MFDYKLIYGRIVLLMTYYMLSPFILSVIPTQSIVIVPIFVYFVCYILYPILKNSEYNLAPLSSPFWNQIFFLYMFWNVGIILRGLLFNYEDMPYAFMLGDWFINKYSLGAYFMPLILLGAFTKFKLKLFVNASLFLNIVFIFVVLMNKDLFFNPQRILYAQTGLDPKSMLLIQDIRPLYLSTAFILFLSLYVNKSKWILNLCCWFITFFITIYAARRSSLFYEVLLFMGAAYFWSFNKGKSLLFRKIIVIAFFSFSAVYIVSNLESKFTLLNDRMELDTRGGVVEDFKADMFSGYDWIWGRGLHGTYYSPNADPLPDGTLVVDRAYMETGYWYIVLHGGIISLFLYLLILGRAVFLGFFRTNNTLTKCMSVYILISLLYLIPFGIPACSLEFIIVWLSAGFCFSNSIRQMSDEEIKIAYF